MLDKTIYLNDDKQFEFLQEGSNRFLSKLKSFWSCSHMNCCLHYMLHINLHILYINFIKLNLNLKEFQASNKYFNSYQENKIEYTWMNYIHIEITFECEYQKPDF